MSNVFDKFFLIVIVYFKQLYIFFLKIFTVMNLNDLIRKFSN